MEAGIRDLRDHLSSYLSLVQDGQELTVTAHGKAIARIIPIGVTRPLDRLIASGEVAPASTPKVSLPMDTDEQYTPDLPIKSAGPVSDLVSDQRR